MKYIRIYVIALVFFIGENTMAQVDNTFTAAWWNVENLFDTRDDPRTNDDEYTPDGELRWTRRKMNNKLHGIYKTILMMGLPDVVGLAEVENKYVLRELCNGTPLSQSGYRYVHYDSPDRRGIDCALLYRSDRFTVTGSRPVSMSDSAEGFFTRDILLVEGVTSSGDTICLLLNHWPSKRGGEEADFHRLEIARTVRTLMNYCHAEHPTAAVVAMGDMNSTAGEDPISLGMGFGADSVNPDGIRNLTARLPKDWGSHKYQGVWDYIDQVFFLGDERWLVGSIKLMRFDHLLIDERRGVGVRPRRTNRGVNYEGGLSDHLPLKLVLRHRDEQ